MNTLRIFHSTMLVRTQNLANVLSGKLLLLLLAELACFATLLGAFFSFSALFGPPAMISSIFSSILVYLTVVLSPWCVPFAIYMLISTSEEIYLELGKRTDDWFD